MKKIYQVYGSLRVSDVFKNIEDFARFLAGDFTVAVSVAWQSQQNKAHFLC